MAKQKNPQPSRKETAILDNMSQENAGKLINTLIDPTRNLTAAETRLAEHMMQAI